MIATRYSYNVPSLGAAESGHSMGPFLGVLGGAFLLGVLGVLWLERSQGGMRRRYR